MKSKAQIEQAISEIQGELNYVRGWINQASETYDQDKKTWANVDRSDLDSAYGAQGRLNARMEALMWVLED